MTGDRIAVIDLGSNTFHLLICEISEDQSWIEIHKEREYVKLASGGIEVIDEYSEQRAIDAMTRFVNLIKTHDVKRVRAIGTAALREAKNGLALAEKLSAITGIEIDIIDGQREAKYILGGIRSALPDLKEYGLIMDIGGGSVEFILFKGKDVAFSGSFKIGVAVLFRMFHHSDPISKVEIASLEKYIGISLFPLVKKLLKTGPYYLIGASGSFEVLNDVLPKRESSTHWAELDMAGISAYIDEVIHATLAERKLMKEIPDERLDYIVVAYLLIRFILRSVPPAKLYYCDYALKEGVIDEMIRE
jgi:exopolyphosphatase / guanosine-5'-triphosphate,3'-diphosphate pyrophosphatase